ncbi:MAG: ATP-binding protein [Alcanivoracaceae bacterium]|nr:ATP-binding protein [Alcanivoracaceae bacterium]
MLERSIQSSIDKALNFSPAVLIAGARQIGKSTLVFYMDREYVVMDDITQLEAATHDPQGYIQNIKKPVTIDEIQKAAHLLTPIKLYIDKNRNNGDFLLTGSANILSLKKANESLAGRLVELTMYPFSAKEKNQDIKTNVVDELFSGNISKLGINRGSFKQLPKFIIEGGYPVAFILQTAKERFLWFNSYISTYIERDIRSIGELRDLDNFIRFFNVIAPRTGSILNKSNISNDTKLTAATIDNYISLLEKVYQIHLLKPYFENIGKTFIKSPKVYLTDSGLASHILGARDENDLEISKYKGKIYETFVFSELLKHITSSKHIIGFFYYRTQDKKEIDFIIKKQDDILAIEVKSSHSVSLKDFKHIMDFQTRSAYKVTGLIFYNGEKTVSFGENLYAVPLAVLL